MSNKGRWLNLSSAFSVLQNNVGSSSLTGWPLIAGFACHYRKRVAMRLISAICGISGKVCPVMQHALTKRRTILLVLPERSGAAAKLLLYDVSLPAASCCIKGC